MAGSLALRHSGVGQGQPSLSDKRLDSLWDRWEILWQDGLLPLWYQGPGRVGVAAERFTSGEGERPEFVVHNIGSWAKG